MNPGKDEFLSEDRTAIPENYRVAYIKPYVVEGRNGYAIHLADGSPVGWYEDREVAAAAILQNDLEPLSVH